MTDFFAVLAEPRRPHFHPESLKSKFLALSAKAHPDRLHNADDAAKRATQQHYAELNAAYQCLRNPRDRLRHLLELESGKRPSDVQQIPPDLANLFFAVAQVCREADAFLSEKAKAESALAKAQLFERSHDQIERLNSIQRTIMSARDQLMNELQAIDHEWNTAASGNSTRRVELLPQLERLYQLFSYFDRWLFQLQERVVLISF